MKLSIIKLNQLLEQNTILTKIAIDSNNITQLVDLINHRVIIKDCIIESLTDKINLLTYKIEVLNAIIDSKCENEEIVSKWD